MKLITAIKLKSGSIRKFAIENDIAYAVLHDICSGKKRLENCKALTVLKIARGLDTTVEELLSARPFQQFRDALHHRLKSLGDQRWLIETLKENEAISLYQRNELLHAIYLVDMVDYICNKHHYPIPIEYNEIRQLKLQEPYFVGDLALISDTKKQEIPENAIKEFLRSNIVECNLYDAV